MIAILSHIATSFGLAGSAGLNAYVPLLIVALTARFTNLITLNKPFDVLTEPIVIAILVVLLLIEILVDKIPAVDTINDAIQTFVRPAAGAILFAASSNAIGDTSPVVALVCGLILAGSVHAVKATARPVVTATTGGLANPLVSAAEDVVSATVSITAILAPLLGVLALVVCFAVLLFWLRGRRKRARTGP
jgi:hypothetical protein